MNGSDQNWEGSSPRVPVVNFVEVAAQVVDAGDAPGSLVVEVWTTTCGRGW
jgi:hypothetical protein